MIPKDYPPKVPVYTKLHHDDLVALDRIADEEQRNRSELIRLALKDFISHRRFIAQGLVRDRA